MLSRPDMRGEDKQKVMADIIDSFQSAYTCQSFESLVNSFLFCLPVCSKEFIL